MFAAAVATELLLLALFLFTKSDSAQGIWIPNTCQLVYIYLHPAAKLIVVQLGCDDFPDYLFCGLITGTFQFFLAYWVVVAIWHRMQRR